MKSTKGSSTSQITLPPLRFRRPKGGLLQGAAPVWRLNSGGAGAGRVRAGRVGAAAKPAAGSTSWVEKYGAALDFGVSADQGLRDEMEDVAALVPKGRCGFLYAGVFDGHAGVQVAQYLGEKLYERVVAAIEAGGAEMAPTAKVSKLAKVLPAVFEQLDSEILQWLKGKEKKGVLDEAGSTATCVFARPDKVLVANVGDSRAVMSRGGKAVDLSTEHRAYGKGPNVKAETARIEATGGWVKNGRVCDMLAVTRAFGDAEFKGAENRQRMVEEGVRDGYWTKKFASSVNFTADPVIATPDVFEIDLEDGDEFLVIASDGLWDVYSSTEAIALLRREYISNAGAQEMADLLVKRAIGRRTQDNVVVIVVVLSKNKLDQQSKTVASRKKKTGLFSMF